MYRKNRWHVEKSARPGQIWHCHLQRQRNDVDVTEMVTCLAVVVVPVANAVVIPLIAIVSMGVMRLVKGFVINGVRHALHGHEEHSDNHRF